MVWRVEMSFPGENGRQDVFVNIISSKLASEVREHIRTGKTIYHGDSEQTKEAMRLDWSKAVSIRIIDGPASQ